MSTAASPYLARLREKNQQIGLKDELTKPTKPAQGTFVSFVSSPKGQENQFFSVDATDNDPRSGALTPDDLAIAHALMRRWGEDDPGIRCEWMNGLRADPARLEGMREMALAAGVARYEMPPAPTTPATDSEPSPKAFCVRCRHWTPDTINPQGGIGRCLIDAPRAGNPDPAGRGRMTGRKSIAINSRRHLHADT